MCLVSLPGFDSLPHVRRQPPRRQVFRVQRSPEKLCSVPYQLLPQENASRWQVGQHVEKLKAGIVGSPDCPSEQGSV